MISKTQQLFLELCLLRARYSSADISRLSDLREIRETPEMMELLRALDALNPDRAKKERAPKKRSSSALETEKDPRKVIAKFLDRVSSATALRTRKELEAFASSLGVYGNLQGRREYTQAIREKLGALPSAQALQKIGSFKGASPTDSEPYIALAKTLMKS
jgi:hypothetical protein